MILIHVNRCDDVEHGTNHLINWGIRLASMREINNDDNDSQGTLVHSNECE